MSEIMGFLFSKIGALISVAAVALVFYSASTMNKSSDAIADQTLLAESINSLYTNGDFTDLSVAIALRVAPKKMINGTALRNPWGGNVTVAVNSSNPSQWDLTQTLVPGDSCIKMLSSITSIVGLRINSTAQTVPITGGSAALACNTTTNTMAFTYSR